MKILTEKDKNKEVILRRGEVFAVTLSSNPSTGYSWYLLTSQNNIWKLEKRSFKEGARDRDGAPGTETLVFGAMRKGGSFPPLVYLRWFEAECQNNYGNQRNSTQIYEQRPLSDFTASCSSRCHGYRSGLRRQ